MQKEPRQMWWHPSILSAMGSLKQEDHRIEASLRYTVTRRERNKVLSC